jgi:hypothetical protein
MSRNGKGCWAQIKAVSKTRVACAVLIMQTFPGEGLANDVANGARGAGWTG